MSKSLSVAMAAALLIAAAPPAATIVEAYSSPLNDYNFGTDAKERTAVFARSQAEFANARIYVSEKSAGKWSMPAPIGFSDERYSDSDPWLTPDGRTLYFVSNRPTAGDGARTDLDIWRSTRSAKGWSRPEHLAMVSSPGPELGVELHGETLYFSSVRKGGKGGLDIYAARRRSDSFEAPMLLDAPINGPNSESDFTLSRDGRLAVFWRSVGGKGMLHMSRRTAAGWSEPRLLPAEANPGDFNFTPHFSSDGRNLWFASTAMRPGQEAGMADIHVAKLPADLK